MTRSSVPSASGLAPNWASRVPVLWSRHWASQRVQRTCTIAIRRGWQSTVANAVVLRRAK
eukprot:1006528-Prymnesium_polylepis.2